MRKTSLFSKVSLAILILLGSLTFLWLVVVRILAKLSGGSPCPYALAWIVDNPLRLRYMGRALDRIGIQPGERVLELGPGPGAFTVDAARRAGLGGSLVAVDIQPEMIAAVESRLHEAGVANAETHVASAYELPLEDASVDRAFLVSVLPEIPDRRRALAELFRVLKPGGILSITEEFLDPDYLLARTTIAWVQAASFELEERHGNWWVYTINFQKPV
jgi:ubiquinone/menaquinone biosynthesis C-methylase UbiE